MDANLDIFEKYIVKHIVDTASFNPVTGEFEINRIHISDDIIREIEEEGERYGLKQNQSRDFISKVSNNIKLSPSATIVSGQINVETIELGQHIRINFVDPDRGDNYLELLSIEGSFFVLLDSSIKDLQGGDTMLPLDKIWNPSYYARFKIKRNGVPYPDDNTVLNVGKLKNVVYYCPSVIHEILDSKYSFTYQDSKKKEKGYRESEKKDLKPSQNSKKYPVWLLRYTPVTFVFDERNEQQEAPFLIIEDEDEDYLSINSGFSFPNDLQEREYILDTVKKSCQCEIRKRLPDSAVPKTMENIVLGKVKRSKTVPHTIVWTLIQKPVVSIFYE